MKVSLAVLASIVPFAAALAADSFTLGRVGDLTFDGSRWEARQSLPSYEIKCRSGRCDASMTMTIGPTRPGDCEASDLAPPHRGRDAEMSTIQRPGLDIKVVQEWYGCRNARPPSVFACMIHDGRTYRLTSVVVGCRGGPGFQDGAMDFLATLGGQ